MRTQVILTIASLAIFLAGVYLAFGLAQTLLVAGAIGAITGLIWEAE